MLTALSWVRSSDTNTEQRILLNHPLHRGDRRLPLNNPTRFFVLIFGSSSSQLLPGCRTDTADQGLKKKARKRQFVISDRGARSLAVLLWSCAALAWSNRLARCHPRKLVARSQEILAGLWAASVLLIVRELDG